MFQNQTQLKTAKHIRKIKLRRQTKEFSIQNSAFVTVPYQSQSYLSINVNANFSVIQKMETGALAVGVFLIVIGVVVFWIGYSDLQQYGGLFGQISQSLSAEVRNKVAQDQFMAVGGGIAAIIGLAVTIYGLAANRK